MNEDKDLINSLNAIRISGYNELTVKGKALYRQKCAEPPRDGELRRSFLQSLLIWGGHTGAELRTGVRSWKAGQALNSGPAPDRGRADRR